MIPKVDDPIYYDLSSARNNLTDVRYNEPGSLVHAFRTSAFQRNGIGATDFTNEPTFLTFAIIFNDNLNFGESSPKEKFTSINESPLFDKTAWTYLMARGHFMEAHLLSDFCHKMQDIAVFNPWFFKDISGLKEMWKANTDMTKPFKGDNKIIKINTLESLDLSMTYLADCYRSFTYDMIYMREILPDNLRWFSMDIYVGEIRNLKISANFSNGKAFDSNNWIHDFGTYMHFRCHQCEFDFSDSVPFDNLSVEKADAASNKFAIKVGWWEEFSWYDSQGGKLSKVDSNGTRFEQTSRTNAQTNSSNSKNPIEYKKINDSVATIKNDDIKNPIEYKQIDDSVATIKNDDIKNPIIYNDTNKVQESVNKLDEYALATGKSINSTKLTAGVIDDAGYTGTKVTIPDNYRYKNQNYNSSYKYIEVPNPNNNRYNIQYAYEGKLNSFLNGVETKMYNFIDTMADMKNTYDNLKDTYNNYKESGKSIFEAIGNRFDDYIYSIKNDINDRYQNIKDYAESAFNPTEDILELIPDPVDDFRAKATSMYVKQKLNNDTLSSVASARNEYDKTGPSFTPRPSKTLDYGSAGDATKSIGKNSADYSNTGDPTQRVDFNKDIYNNVEDPTQKVEFDKDIYNDVEDPTQKVEFDDPELPNIDNPTQAVKFNDDIYKQVEDPTQRVEFKNDTYNKEGIATQRIEFSGAEYNHVDGATQKVEFENDAYGKEGIATEKVDFSNDVYDKEGIATERVQFDNDVYKNIGDATQRVEFENNAYGEEGIATERVEFKNDIYDNEGIATERVEFDNEIYKNTGIATERVNFSNDIYKNAGQATQMVEFSNDVYDKEGIATKNIETTNDVYKKAGTATIPSETRNDVKYETVQSPTLQSVAEDHSGIYKDAAKYPAIDANTANPIKYKNVKENEVTTDGDSKKNMSNIDVIGDSIFNPAPARSLFEDAWRGQLNKQ